MSQGSLTLPTTGTLSGLTLVQLVNAALANLASLASGATDPATLSGGVQAFSLWVDTSVTPNTIRMRNAANNGWATMGTISGSNFVPDLQSSDITTALGYTPARADGANASGTWPISINGNAATATTATSATSAGSAGSATNATNAANLVTSNFSVIESGGKLVFKYGTSVIASVSSSGHFVASGDVSGSGTP